MRLGLITRFLTCGALVLFWPGFVPKAEATQMYAQTKLVYQFSNVQGCGICNHGPGPYETDQSAAWADAQAAVTNCTGGICYTAQNFHADPNSYLLNGVAYRWYFDVQACQNGTCNTFPNTGTVLTSTVCPGGGSGSNYNIPANNRLMGCPITIPTAITQQPEKCESCQGNPIYTSTAEKVERESDYSAPTTLSYTRTYRSTLGSAGVTGISSAASQAGFYDFSQTSGTPYSGCLPAWYTIGALNSYYCFPYMGTGQTSSQYSWVPGMVA
jgi:hypothetical protein